MQFLPLLYVQVDPVTQVIQMYKSHMKFFMKAKQAALASDFPKVHIGCIAVYGNTIIGIGCNTNKTHPLQQYYNRYRTLVDDNGNYLLPKTHAEMNCINSLRHLDIPFSKVKLYIFRIQNAHPCGMARPCPSCMAAIMDLGIREIYYTTNDGYAFEKLHSQVNNGVV